MGAWPDSVVATHSGLRGRPDVDLTPAVVSRAVGGLVTLLNERGLPRSLGVARDGRPESRNLAAEAIAFASEAGVDVVDFGAVATPTAKLAARIRGLGGAVIVTGSHLQPEWNGLKLVAAPRYVPVDIRELPAETVSAGRRGRVSEDRHAARDHIEAVCRSVDVEVVRQAALSVAWTGGVGAEAAVVLERLGCRPRGSEVDVGLRLDADGDRLGLVDERGIELPSDAVLALAVRARRARAVVKGADTSRMVDDLVSGHGGSVRVVAPGELHLVGALAESGGDLAGEGNGGVVPPAVGAARDGLAAAAAILELLARTREPLSRVAAGLPRYAIRRSTIPCPRDRHASLGLDDLARSLGVAEPGDPEEGLRVEAVGGAWGLVRRSATEPVLRVTAEAPTAAAADALHAELRTALASR